MRFQLSVDKPVRLWTSGFPAPDAPLATLILKRWLERRLGGCRQGMGWPVANGRFAEVESESAASVATSAIRGMDALHSHHILCFLK
ncbi:hypothetical protein Sp245p_19845 (plasmid) [Azospirillum baldaniorum]|uniref:Uncharacterized protein n=1 Tax=Azospirillum baldaniorum TaxID=1064539 RepID=A0A9P1NP50_9PROT|nr:hypothetical protein Sp245p_19845 [Azospirillum baldaniorum]CCD00491.1 protein of unknown function [Azospirillum baldaniorum]